MGRARSVRTRPRSADAPSLVTSRNNSDYPSGTPFIVPRPYVQACCKGTLATYRAGVVRFGALTCGSWSCPHCRRALAARTLDRLRRGLEARAGSNLALVTPTLDPAAFGAYRIGSQLWDDGRETNLWSEPTAAQFAAAVAAMSAAFARMMDALNTYARRRGLARFGYFRVIELHRNLWPHYHVVLEHRELDPALLELGWDLGICDVRTVDVDTAVGELAPYLVATESKGRGSKAYQFAARALPKGFRLYTGSRHFLAPHEGSDDAPPDDTLILRGHFTSYHLQARAWGAESRLALCAPTAADRPHRPPSAAIATGDGAVVLYAELAHARALHMNPATLHTSRLGPVSTASAHDKGTAPPRAGPDPRLPPD